MLLGPRIINKYTCLAQSLAAGQSLQSLALGSSRMAPRLYVTNTLSKYKHIQANNRNELKQYTNHDKTETKHLKTNSTCCNEHNGTKNAKNGAKTEKIC